jgi:hypothetical protein
MDKAWGKCWVSFLTSINTLLLRPILNMLPKTMSNPFIFLNDTLIWLSLGVHEVINV